MSEVIDSRGPRRFVTVPKEFRLPSLHEYLKVPVTGTDKEGSVGERFNGNPTPLSLNFH